MQRHQWTLLILPLIALALFGISNSAKNKVSQASSTSQIKPKERQSSDDKHIEHLTEETLKKMGHIQRELSKFASSDQQQAELARLYIKQRESRYLSLFSKWKLDSKILPQVFKILEQREFEIRAAQSQYTKSQNVEQYQYDRSLADATSEDNLTRLLGQNRAEELKKFESAMRLEARADRND